MIAMCMHLLIPQRVCYTSALLEGVCGNFVFVCKLISVNYNVILMVYVLLMITYRLIYSSE